MYGDFFYWAIPLFFYSFRWEKWRFLFIQMAHEMADAAQRILKKVETDDVKVNIERVKESSQNAVGNGSGIT